MTTLYRCVTSETNRQRLTLVVKVQNIEILVLVVSKGPRGVDRKFLQFTEHHFRALIEHHQWWEATRIFMILCSEPDSQPKWGRLEIPIKELVEHYKTLTTCLDTNGFLDSSTMPEQSIAKKDSLICALVAKSMFMDRVVTLLKKERREPITAIYAWRPTETDAWKLHAEVGQLLQHLSLDSPRVATDSHYCEIWKMCETILIELRRSETAKRPSSNTDRESGMRQRPTSPETLMFSSSR